MNRVFSYDRGDFQIANIGDKVIYVNHSVENDNSPKAFYGKIDQWYEVLDVKKVEVGNEKFTNPYRYKIKINNLGIDRYDFIYFSAFQFMTEREWRESQLVKLL